MSRVRFQRTSRQRIPFSPGKLFQFVNPYPEMSAPEAMVHLELERRKLPFSWRYFDGDAPAFKYLMPDFTPEFTLSDYKVVILILGNFTSFVPGVLDTNALAMTLLEQDGWHVYALWENDIRADVKKAIDGIPELANPSILGPPKPNPLGIRPDYMRSIRERFKSASLLRAKFFTKGDSKNHADKRHPLRRGRRRRFARGESDSGGVAGT